MTFAVIFTSLLIALSGYIVNEKNAVVELAHEILLHSIIDN